jgi:predicted 2-oxoglutarate/Fe(II)-dependent dioxygenase YbiX/peroxiredoxin
MTQLTLGAPAPWFTAPSPSNPTFAFSSVAGRYILLGFPPADAAGRDAALAAMSDRPDLFDDIRACAFVVLRDPTVFANCSNRVGVRWFLDADGAIARAYGALSETGEERPAWLLLDPSLRILMSARADQTAEVVARLAALPPPDAHAGVPMHAPVLIVPRIFEPDLCRRLIRHYEETGGAPSGVMREVDGKTVGVLDNFKKRRDASIDDVAFQQELNLRIARRLLPEIRKAFQYKATRIERHIVACYDAGDGGYFRPHRDNTTAGTAHRRFAVSINLNAEEFEGGDLRFAEFGSRTYRPPTGGAVVFSCSLLHEATPVTRGRRYAFLPFLYDDEAAAIRERNRHLLAVPQPPAPAEPQAQDQAEPEPVE